MTRLLFEPLTHQLGDASLQSIKPCVGSEANYYGIYLPLKGIYKDLCYSDMQSVQPILENDQNICFQQSPIYRI